MSNVKADKELHQRHLKVLSDLLARPENKECADCNAKGPRWASTNLGVFICIRCAGLHRNLGTHISKVRSTTLDTWTPEQIECVKSVGNEKAKAIYEAKLPSNKKKPDENEDSRVVDQWIRAKYERKLYFDPHGAPIGADGASLSEGAKKPKKEKVKKTKKPKEPEASDNIGPSRQPTAPKASSSVSLLDFNSDSRQNDTMFTEFVGASAPAPKQAPTTPNGSAYNQNEMFAPAAAAPAKTTADVKDSILSLFQTPGQGQPQPQYYQPQQYFNAPNAQLRPPMQPMMGGVPMMANPYPQPMYGMQQPTMYVPQQPQPTMAYGQPYAQPMMVNRPPMQPMMSNGGMMPMNAQQMRPPQQPVISVNTSTTTVQQQGWKGNMPPVQTTYKY